LTFVTAPYALKANGSRAVRVVDVDNLLARMLREAYQQATGMTIRARRWLAWRKFQRYEKWLFGQFDLSLTVTERDRQTLLKLLRGKPQQVGVAPNGVDTAYNHPGLAQVEPETLVFNGALTYSANYEAMEYFLSQVFPTVLARVPRARLRVTGKTEGVALDRLRLNDNVSLTGYLEDIRPTVAASWACVVPLLAGGGTRLKILEAMALGTPVISTSKGAEGLDATDGKHLLIADTPDQFAEKTVRLLQEPELRLTLAHNARQLVLDKYDWAGIGRHVCDLVERCRPLAPRTGG
jgi:glycosyltransferase involved in cell wall biosynthesis